jgi:hypothetical protein
MNLDRRFPGAEIDGPSVAGGSKKADGLEGVLDAIAKMAPEDRAVAERVVCHSSRLICRLRRAALTRANGWSALVPPFAGPFTCGQDADLDLAPVIKRRGPAEGLVPAGLALIRVTAG